MTQRIVIFGGLEDDHDRAELLSNLQARATEEPLEWEWVKCSVRDGWRPPVHVLNRVMGQLQQSKDQTTTVVLLKRLNKDVKNRILSVVHDPVLVDPDQATGPQLVEWLFSEHAGIIPQLEWHVETRTAALFCLLSKLVRKKSWNKDKHGHAWTHEAHLLNDSPVNVPGRAPVRAAVLELLPMLTGTLLLTKGGNQGKTPKEWSIYTGRLSLVKEAFLTRSLVPIESDSVFETLVRYLKSGDGALYRIDDIIGEQRVREICRDRQEDRGSARSSSSSGNIHP